MTVKNLGIWLVVTAATALLCGCVGPTPYKPVPEGQPGGFGYVDAKVEDALFRVSFKGNRGTPWRSTAAYTLYRSSEIAKEAGAPAFNVLEGNIDRTVLEGTDKFARADGSPLDTDGFSVARLVDGAGPADRVVGGGLLPTIRTAGFTPIVMPRVMPMPAPSVPRTTTYAPVYIYTPTGPVVFPQESWLIRLLPSVPTDDNPRVFVTEEVLTRLGPRIVRKPVDATPNNKGEAPR